MSSLVSDKEKKLIVTMSLFTIAWVFFAVPWFNSIAQSINGTSFLYVWAIQKFGFLIAMGLLGSQLFGTKFDLASLFSVGALSVYLAFDLLDGPWCVSQAGNLLLSPENMSCAFSTDTLVSSLFNLLGVQYGDPIMYHLTYIGGSILFIYIAATVMTGKELRKAIGGMLDVS